MKSAAGLRISILLRGTGVLIVLADKTKPTEVYDGSLVMGNLMLAAHSLGLGRLLDPIGPRNEFERPEGKALLKTLGITGEWEGIGHCAVGYVKGDIPSLPCGRNIGCIG